MIGRQWDGVTLSYERSNEWTSMPEATPGEEVVGGGTPLKST